MTTLGWHLIQALLAGGVYPFPDSGYNSRRAWEMWAGRQGHWKQIILSQWFQYPIQVEEDIGDFLSCI